MDKSSVFQEELSWIESLELRAFTKKAIENLPDYFFRVAASSTGKYHPAYALGPGGLVRHTKAAARVAHELLRLEMYGRYEQGQKDIMLAAIILHDGLKHGHETGSSVITEERFTVAEHPVLCADWLRTIPGWEDLLTPQEMDSLTACIKSHMGQWNTDYRSRKEILPKPITSMEKFVHQCDYLASRKWLTVEFDSYYKPEEDREPELVTDPALEAKVAAIVALCSDLVKQGHERSSLFEVISTHNKGNRNPNSISDMETANVIYDKLNKIVEVQKNE